MQQSGYGYPAPYYAQQPAYHQPQPYPYGPSPAPAPYAQAYYYPSPAATTPFPQQAQAPETSRPGRHSSTNKKPLKSAMKPTKNRPSTGSRPNSAQGYANGAPITRKRTYSGGTNRTSQSGHSTASRTFVPEHIFITFVGDNQIEIENLQDQRVFDAIKEDVLPLWPSRAQTSTDKKERQVITFNGSPWTTSGYHPRKIVQQLFKVLLKQRWHFLASVSPTNPKKGSARLCFSRVSYDTTQQFIPVWFSNSGWTINVIDPAPHMCENIELGMRATFRNRVKESEPTQPSREWSCTLKPSSRKDPDVDKALITARLLQIMRIHSFDLLASIPLGTNGLLGFGSKKEIWIFQKIPRPAT